MSRAARRNLVDRDGALSIRRQCVLMGISRSSVYYAPRGESAENLALMRRMDALSLQYPFYGSRQMARHLRREGVAAGRRRVRRLMGLIGLEAIYRKPRTSDAQPDHHVYPYLLRELKIDRPDQVWCADITYIPVTTGFLYLVAIMDWASRHVLSWRLSNTMDSSFCVEALEAALQTGTPGIFNTDQGSQFTSAAFTDRVQAAGARCSMDGRGRCLDNVFIERLWRSLKYEAVYLHELADGFVAEQVISEWMTFYKRRASALGARRTHAGRSLPRGAGGVNTRAAGRGTTTAGIAATTDAVTTVAAAGERGRQGTTRGVIYQPGSTLTKFGTFPENRTTSVSRSLTGSSTVPFHRGGRCFVRLPVSRSLTGSSTVPVHRKGGSRQRMSGPSTMSHPAMWTCPACGRPLTVALNPEGGEAGAHRPLEISRASAAAHACAPAARFPQFHNASSSSITGYEPASCQPWQPPVSAGAEDDEGVISQSEYTLTKPSSCPNHRDHVTFTPVTCAVSLSFTVTFTSVIVIPL